MPLLEWCHILSLTEAAVHQRGVVAERLATSVMECAKWTPDCSGKQDFDIPLISISTRYWPDHTAVASLMLWENASTHGDYTELSRENFNAKSEAELKVQVQAWVKQELVKLYKKVL